MIHHSDLLQLTRINKRTKYRFFLSKGTLIFLTFKTEDNLLEESLESIVIDDSDEGCGLIILKDSPLISEHLLRLKPGSICSMNINNQPPILGELVWVKELDDLIIRLGIKYINANHSNHH
ncbi:MAG: hypothetical protein AB4063_17890 [Crocosphaera sp.]